MDLFSVSTLNKQDNMSTNVTKDIAAEPNMMPDAPIIGTIKEVPIRSQPIYDLKDEAELTRKRFALQRLEYSRFARWHDRDERWLP
jgi:hypothetical protein